MHTLALPVPVSDPLWASHAWSAIGLASAEQFAQTAGMNSAADDRQTLHTARNRALDGFFRGIEARALRMAELASKNRDDALELVQEAMLSFVKNYAAKPESEWQKLFYAVLDSKIGDFHRRQSVRNRFRVFFGFVAGSPQRGGSGEEQSQEEVLQHVADQQQPDPSDAVLQRQSARAIEAALQTLPDRQRQAFLLRIWEGFDVAQTAEVMRCSEGSVKTHLSRAMEKMRGQLQRFDEHSEMTEENKRDQS